MAGVKEAVGREKSWLWRALLRQPLAAAGGLETAQLLPALLAAPHMGGPEAAVAMQPMHRAPARLPPHAPHRRRCQSYGRTASPPAQG